MPAMTDLYVGPEQLFGPDPVVSHEGERWCVLHTQPRCEKTLSQHLIKKNVSSFLPLYERCRRVQRRLVRTQLPLFPGYVFLHGDDDDRIAALATNKVANCLEVADQERIAHDLAQIYEMITSGVALSPEERLQPGMLAEITSGPLAGRRGTVVRRGSSTRLVIEVDFLQSGASVEVEFSMVQPI
ncbi:MAG: antitermination protein NusG [Planctomycetaceae bacterium]|nr:antitermination protein NusG [Planctomycetaceae bacterium]